MLSLACCVGRRTLEFMRTISVSRFMHHAMPDIVLFNLGSQDNSLQAAARVPAARALEAVGYSDQLRIVHLRHRVHWA